MTIHFLLQLKANRILQDYKNQLSKANPYLGALEPPEYTHIYGISSWVIYMYICLYKPPPDILLSIKYNDILQYKTY